MAPAIPMQARLLARALEPRWLPGCEPARAGRYRHQRKDPCSAARPCQYGDGRHLRVAALRGGTRSVGARGHRARPCCRQGGSCAIASTIPRPATRRLPTASTARWCAMPTTWLSPVRIRRSRSSITSRPSRRHCAWQPRCGRSHGGQGHGLPGARLPGILRYRCRGTRPQSSSTPLRRSQTSSRRRSSWFARTVSTFPKTPSPPRLAGRGRVTWLPLRQACWPSSTPNSACATS